MLITLLNWTYIGITTYIAGFFILERISGPVFGPDRKAGFSITDRLMCGLFAITVYAGFFSIFHKVGIAANIILTALCAAMLISCAKDLLNDLKKRAGEVLHNPVFILTGLVVFVFTLMYTAEGSFQYDTGLYHAQTIHWLEDYGMVKGLGLLHFRLAYNSEYFPLCALYSFRDITGGQSLHSMSGYIVMIVCMYSLNGLIRSFSQKTIMRSSALSDCLRLVPFLGLLAICLEMTSPETDFVVSFVFYWVCIRYAVLCEEEQPDPLSFALLSVTAFALIGYKLTAAPALLFVFFSVIDLIKEKRYGLILLFGSMCLLILLPYLIRNYFVSGWLIYPFDGIDIFNVPWKVPLETLKGDAGMITQFAQVGGSRVPEGITMEALGWLYSWWGVQHLAPRLFYSTLLLCLVFVLILLIIGMIKAFRKTLNITPCGKKMTILVFILLCSLIFWFVKAPLLRYGYHCVLTFPPAVCGSLLGLLYRGREKQKYHAFWTILSLAASIVIFLPTIMSISPICKFDYEESMARYDFGAHLIKQVDYPVPETKQIEWHGIKAYLPVEGDQMWYEPFISSPYSEPYEQLEWFGDDVSDGFYLK
ncbi:MAG: hypothetical protein K6F86_10335 [Lachnospiraceae bacterium]|nr:hypothetical protein [Lachnospiraceae bacterium]